MSTFPDMVYAMGGVPCVGDGIPISTGKYWFVHSGTGSDLAGGNMGKRPTQPFATINYAKTQCTANKNDVIVVMPGHAETVSAASGINLSVAGVTVVGLGNGANRPTISLSAATATIAVSAANCTIDNIIVTSTAEDNAVAIVVTAANATISRCSFTEPTAGSNILTCISTTAAGLTVDGCDRYSVDVATLAMISVLASVANISITNNVDIHTYGADVGQFIILGAFNVVNFKCIGNKLHIVGDNSGQSVGNLITGSSTASDGIVANNYIGGVDVGGLVDTATLEFSHFENYFAGIAAKSGLILPAIT